MSKKIIKVVVLKDGSSEVKLKGSFNDIITAISLIQINFAKSLKDDLDPELILKAILTTSIKEIKK
jgi:hypothetical protein